MENIFDFIFFQKNDISTDKISSLSSLLIAIAISLSFYLAILVELQARLNYSMLILVILGAALLGAAHLYLKSGALIVLLKLFDKPVFDFNAMDFMKKYIFTFTPLALLLPIGMISNYYDVDRTLDIAMKLLLVVWTVAIQIHFCKKTMQTPFIKAFVLVIVSDISEFFLYVFDFAALLILLFLLV